MNSKESSIAGDCFSTTKTASSTSSAAYSPGRGANRSFPGAHINSRNRDRFGATRNLGKRGNDHAKATIILFADTNPVRRSALQAAAKFLHVTGHFVEGLKSEVRHPTVGQLLLKS